MSACHALSEGDNFVMMLQVVVMMLQVVVMMVEEVGERRRSWMGDV